MHIFFPQFGYINKLLDYYRHAQENPTRTCLHSNMLKRLFQTTQHILFLFYLWIDICPVVHRFNGRMKIKYFYYTIFFRKCHLVLLYIYIYKCIMAYYLGNVFFSCIRIYNNLNSFICSCTVFGRVLEFPNQ